MRWYIAPPENRSMDDLFSLGGYSLWETDVERPDPRGIPLTPSRYAGADASVFLGQSRHGTDEAFADGAEELPTGPPVFPLCDGEAWDTTVVYHPQVQTSLGPDGQLALRGGVAVGGKLTVSIGCYVPFGPCPDLRGGVVVGGAFTLPGTGRLTLAGGSSAGGELFAVSSGLTLRGGAAAGGRAMRLSSSRLALRGGAWSGAQAMRLSASRLALQGGVTDGGRLRLAGSPRLALRGGVILGGRLAVEVCGPVARFRGGDGPVSGAGRFPVLPLPAAAESGDTLVAFLFQINPAATSIANTGWLTLFEGYSPDTDWHVTVATARYVPGMAPYGPDGGVSSEWYGGTVALSDVYAVTAGDIVGGHGAGALLPSRDMPRYAEYVVAALGVGLGLSAGPPGFAPAWPADTDVSAFHRETLPPGPTGLLEVSFDRFTPYAAVSVYAVGYCDLDGRVLLGLRGGAAAGGALAMTGLRFILPPPPPPTFVGVSTPAEGGDEGAGGFGPAAPSPPQSGVGPPLTTIGPGAPGQIYVDVSDPENPQLYVGE